MDGEDASGISTQLANATTTSATANNRYADAVHNLQSTISTFSY
jgi:hypothetical protein